MQESIHRIQLLNWDHRRPAGSQVSQLMLRSWLMYTTNTPAGVCFLERESQFGFFFAIARLNLIGSDRRSQDWHIRMTEPAFSNEFEALIPARWTLNPNFFTHSLETSRVSSSHPHAQQWRSSQVDLNLYWQSHQPKSIPVFLFWYLWLVCLCLELLCSTWCLFP